MKNNKIGCEYCEWDTTIGSKGIIVIHERCCIREEKMKKFAIVNKSTMSLDDNFWFRVHTINCRDIKQDEIEYGGEHYIVVASSVLEAVNKEVDSLLKDHGNDSGWSTEMFQILPCTK